MILIADSGSTKTNWALIDSTSQLIQMYPTSGINPYQQEEEEIEQQLLQELPIEKEIIQQIYYYGAGATTGSRQKLENSLGKVFRNSYFIDIQSDIFAAAYALCNQEAGIACILGTGSNSCEYDGKKIRSNIGGFGFILGDEGSGAVLGKQLMSDFLYKKMPGKLWEELQATYKLSPNLILEKVYRQPYPNRFLAGFAPFLHQNEQEVYIQSLINTQFHLFFKQKVLCYQNVEKLPIHFTGSIAHYFKKSLFDVASELGLQIGNILQHPIQGLIRYHQHRMS